ncbi:MAG TPA: hypothetical protein VF165_23635 [Nocardioidaceae bacterium]
MDSPDAEAMIPPMNATRSDKAIAFSDGVQQPPGKTTHVNVIQVFPLVMEHSTSPLGPWTISDRSAVYPRCVFVPPEPDARSAGIPHRAR